MTAEEKLVDSFRFSNASGYTDFNKRDLAEVIRLHVEAREQAAAREERDRCIKVVTRYHSLHPEWVGEILGKIADEILPSRSLDKALLEARLEEAEWWKGYIRGQYGNQNVFHENSYGLRVWMVW